VAISRTKPSASITRTGQMRPNPRSAGSGASHRATDVDHDDQTLTHCSTPRSRRSIFVSHTASKIRSLRPNQSGGGSQYGREVIREHPQPRAIQAAYERRSDPNDRLLAASPPPPAGMIDVGVHSANVT